MKTPLPKYTGNKNIPGLLHLIMNNIPEVHTICEPFCGSGIISYCAPHRVHTILNDLDLTVVFAHVNASKPNSTVCSGNGIELIRSYCNSGVTVKKILVYCDPPYLISSRNSGNKMYRKEFSVDDHVQFISAVRDLKCFCMISHPRNKMYDKLLNGWRRIDKRVCYNGKITVESIYMNYAVPAELMTYDYLGNDCWDRQRLKRMKENFVGKLKRLPDQERNMLLMAAKAEFFCMDHKE